MDDNIKQLIQQVQDRAMIAFGFEDEQSLKMDLHSAEKRLQLNWERLFSFDEFNFAHDIAQIVNHIDRSDYPGQFPDWFCPRCGFREIDAAIKK